jgi:hypothetical protein
MWVVAGEREINLRSIGAWVIGRTGLRKADS